MFGTSTANIKIESTWMRMIGSQTRPWLVSKFAVRASRDLIASPACGWFWPACR
jgi:hypothetical protein